MKSISIQNVTTFEHLELDSDTHSWVRSVNHCFAEDTVVETMYTPGLYITVLGQCHYSSLSNDSEQPDNFNYHYSVALADQSCLSRVLFPANAIWQTFSIMIPFDQLPAFGITDLNEPATHFRPEARLSVLGAISGDILRCCESVWQCDLKGLERQLFIKAKALEVLALFLHKRRESGLNPLSSRLSILNDVLCHIENHLDHDWTLSSVASLARSNQTYIKQDVKDLLGMSFRKWLNKKRLNAAVDLLSSDVPISQIATDIGYKSQAHFATLFKNEIGMTPSEYRQSLQLSNKIGGF